MKLFRFLSTKSDDTSKLHQIAEQKPVEGQPANVHSVMDADMRTLEQQIYQLQQEVDLKEQTNRQLIADQMRVEEVANRQSMDLENLKGIIRLLEANNAELTMRPTQEELGQKDDQIQRLALRLKTVGQEHVSKDVYEQAKKETELLERRLQLMQVAAEKLKAKADKLEVEVQSSTPAAVHTELEKRYVVLQMSHTLRIVENHRLAQELDEKEEKYKQLQQLLKEVENPASVAHEHAASAIDELASLENIYHDSEEKNSIALANLEETIAVQLELEDEENEILATPDVLPKARENDQPMLAEKEVDETQMLQTMSDVLLTTMSTLEEAKVPEIIKAPSFPSYSESSFLPRDDKSEYDFLQKVLRKLKSLMRPIRKVEFDSTYSVDYASAYAEGIIRKRSQAHNRRLQAIEDSPFVARVDFVTMNGMESMYIGEQGIDGYVTNWKAEAASLYYLRTVGQPISHKTLGDVIVDYIRQIDIRYGKIAALHPPLTASSEYFQDEGLVSALSDKRGVDMQAIVATLQREQYEIIRLPMTKPIIIQGSAGSGKSAIALHRLSYLLYKYENLSPERVAILGPNEAFLAHIKNVLPSLGDFGIKQTTFLNMACDILGLSPAGMKRHSVKGLELIKAKGSLEFREIVQRKTMGLFNDLRTWATPVLVGSTTVPILPILSEMEKYPDLPLKERENLYFNFFLKSLQREMKEQNELSREWKQWVREQAKGMEEEKVSNLPLFQTNFMSEQITILGEKWMQDAASYAKDASTKMKKKMEESRRQFLAAIQHAVQLKMEEHSANVKERALGVMDESLIMDAWLKQMKQKMREQREVVILKHIASQQKEVLNTADLMQDLALKAQLEKLQEQLLQKFPAEKLDFIDTRKAMLHEALHNESLAEIERAYYRQIIGALKREYKINHSFSNDYPRFVFEEESVLSDADEKTLLNYVKKNLKRDLLECYEIAVQMAKDEGVLPVDWNKVEMYYEDLPALLHINRLLHGAPKDHLLSYLIIDEAQDYMPYEITELHALTRKNGIMLIGDLGQNLNRASTLQDWNGLGELIGDLSLHELKATYRSTAQIVEVSNEIIEPFASGKYMLSTETFRDGEPVKLKEFKFDTEEKELIAILEQAIYDHQFEPVAVIVKDESMIEQYHYMIDPYFSVAIQTVGELPTDTKVVITTPSAVKGLEFEAVVITRFSDYQPTDDDRKLAYVATSRALHQLYLMVEEEKERLIIEV
ncbi:ATP-binding domain-containing protein [Sporosarcina sp. ACRSM]|uniref:3'-5' exonuclease n=1 Tax=Sporosarcina sp. ACRSM TaxID=2918216 RepID=UPI001EF6C861|nr:3'-5' exonuclease [Sporosarcina sp. ACRSM]MCG7333689.1 ATP-binding domain-containing protein [Sporosarcina sp. ACRSM]